MKNKRVVIAIAVIVVLAICVLAAWYSGELRMLMLRAHGMRP